MHEELPSTLITWDEIYSLCRQLVQQLRKANFRIDVIVSIARGGYIPGRLLSDMLGIHDLTCFKIEHYQGAFQQQETFVLGVEHIRQCGTVNEMRTAALHLKTVSKFVPDFYAETVSEWRWLIYPWAVNEDLSSMIAKMQLANFDAALLQRLIKERHGIDVTHRQIEDALMLLQNPKKQ